MTGPALAARRLRGYTLIELLVAMTVVAAGVTMLVAMLVIARRKARLQCQRQMAAALAQATFERLRGAPRAALPGKKPVAQPLPPEAAELSGASAVASATPWKAEKGVLRLRVTVTWNSRAAGRRRVTREGLLGDARAR